MTRSEELWDEIKKQIVTDDLLRNEELERIQRLVLSSNISAEDWMLAIENTLLKDNDDGK